MNYFLERLRSLVDSYVQYRKKEISGTLSRARSLKISTMLQFKKKTTTSKQNTVARNTASSLNINQHISETHPMKASEV